MGTWTLWVGACIAERGKSRGSGLQNLRLSVLELQPLRVHVPFEAILGPLKLLYGNPCKAQVYAI